MASTRQMLFTATLCSGLGLLLTSPLWAWDGIVEKHTFEIDSFTTQGGETIPNVTVGWEAYGELNEARDNVILITHFSQAPAMQQAVMIRMANQPATGMPSLAPANRWIPMSTTLSPRIRW
ncbi:hypothetical protein HSBAA_09960 [Vreelandella sulfidaeris]|uniref:Uncharacterized protein n=1 Tax=Vreelandella sulfidaeris TaxID=115553 RepID=A0A455U141_9GAMM|nr:hypothetical protein HSBAA_09960 [Halomonas sulfidaeris]